MKKILLIIAYLGISCNGTQDVKNKEPTIIATNTRANSLINTPEGAYLKLENNRFDFGDLNKKRHPEISIDVKFSNTGTEPLVILKADVSCGCISVDYPKEPIMPNQISKITVHVDVRAQDGVFNKVIFIKTNSKDNVELIRVIGSVQ